MTTKRKEGDEQLRCGSCGGEQVRIFGTRSRGVASLARARGRGDGG
mgnify:CR=1 FL=1